MRTFKDTLDKELQPLKEVYLKSIVEYYTELFNKLTSLTEQDVINTRGYLEKSARNPEGAYRHTKASFSYWGKISSIRYKGLDNYVEKQKKIAELNFEVVSKKIYDKCVSKNMLILNAAIIYYGLDKDGSPRLEVTDGVRSVWCYTIIAMGEIQRPHYRFLVK